MCSFPISCIDSGSLDCLWKVGRCLNFRSDDGPLIFEARVGANSVLILLSFILDGILVLGRLHSYLHLDHFGLYDRV